MKRRLSLFSIATVIVLAQASAPAHAQAATKTGSLPTRTKAPSQPLSTVPAELIALEKKYAVAGTVTADFTQVTTSGLIKSKKTSQGSLVFQRPDRIHWEEKQPEKSLLVSDGKTFWMYTPAFAEGERGQVLIQRARDVRTDLSRALLSAQFSTVKGIKIEPAGEKTWTLTPKEGSAGTVLAAQFRIGAESGLVEWVKLEHQGGNIAEIKLENVKLGVAVSPKFFTFQIPPRTEVIR